MADSDRSRVIPLAEAQKRIPGPHRAWRLPGLRLNRLIRDVIVTPRGNDWRTIKDQFVRCAERSLLGFSLGLIIVGCASLPPQSRPSTVAPFVGAWKGQVTLTSGTAYENILVLIDPADGNAAKIAIVHLQGVFDLLHWTERGAEVLWLREGELLTSPLFSLHNRQPVI